MPQIILPVQHVQQQRLGECLAACAAMVLNYIGMPSAYGRLVKLLENAPGVGVASFKIRNLERIGVHVQYQRGTLEQLRNQLMAGHPCIVFVQTRELPYRNDDTAHAIVIVGFDEQNLFVDDPEYDVSPVSVSAGDFDFAWLEHDEKYAVITG